MGRGLVQSSASSSTLLLGAPGPHSQDGSTSGRRNSPADNGPGKEQGGFMDNKTREEGLDVQVTTNNQ